MSTTVFWIVQALGIVSTIITIFTFVCQTKWKMMILLSTANVVLMATYILSGSLIGGLLVAGALARTIVYFIYSKLNRKPEIVFVILFELYFIVLAIVMWNNIIDILMVLNLIVLTYTTWQDDLTILRAGYVISSLLLVPYDILLGAYTTAASECIMLASVIITLIKYTRPEWKPEQIVTGYFAANKNFWGVDIKDYDNYTLINSPKVDNTPYYNFCLIKNHNQLYDTLLQVNNTSKQCKIRSLAYLPFNNKQFTQNLSDASLLKSICPLVYQDVWMKLIDGFNLNNTRCKIQGVEYRQLTNKDINDLISVYINGYLNKKTLNHLTDNEKNIVSNLKRINLNTTKPIKQTQIYAYAAYYQNAPISLVIMLASKTKAYVTKVCTITQYRRNHVASALIQYAINKQRRYGVQDFILVTDKYSSNEQFYLFNNFKEFGQGYVLDVQDIEQYKNFIEDFK